jgi:hypothetical protein
MLESSKLAGLEGMHMVGTSSNLHLLVSRTIDGIAPLKGEIPKIYGELHVR